MQVRHIYITLGLLQCSGRFTFSNCHEQPVIITAKTRLSLIFGSGSNYHKTPQEITSKMEVRDLIKYERKESVRMVVGAGYVKGNVQCEPVDAKESEFRKRKSQTTVE
ncbi:hypothetical protein K435DRAFT_846743 [Dendrothele bispora CBS 962.96]|uniref:Uncharacterized protein n=1 Tax=Dendrothele bispora (strain CBS 962.96) TaxID=1314807 RepID=A0A4V4HAM2_DENBC|nr:hypothetical protein K435DRAFT_846743 [Dendrothele bispora CBS 962.96]